MLSIAITLFFMPVYDFTFNSLSSYLFNFLTL